MKRNPIINAIKFLGYQTDETKALGLQPIPTNMQIQCRCGNAPQKHLTFRNQLICPYNYIIFEGTEITGVMDIKRFESMYEQISYQDATFTETSDIKEK